MAAAVLDVCTYEDRVRAVDWQGVLRRAQHLPPADEALMRIVCQGTSCRTAARALKIPAGTASRRVRRLLQLLQDPLVVALIDMPRGLTPEQQQIGIEYYLLRRSLRGLCRLHQLPELEVRRILAYLPGWAKGRTQAIRKYARKFVG